ncbi:hypothetical protein [uncultured Microscilla sp.]|uniref:hypothetical protein n=1 Tax=uncultured Microscilla sp. TaxID=432653 RepID=UPI002631143C|nr:hypothetical protein [uncultured Microscilla sp.]
MNQSVFLESVDFNYLNDALIDKIIDKYPFTFFNHDMALMDDLTMIGTDVIAKMQAYNEQVITGGIVGSSEELALESIEYKINLDNEFRGFLFNTKLKKESLKKIDNLLNQKLCLILLLPFNHDDELKAKAEELRNDISIDDTTFEGMERLNLMVLYDALAPLIDYFKQHNRLNIINTINKTHEEVFKEVCQVIDNT